ncbi:MAG: carboxymuconolactone decarboxylase family protein [Yokenella regensburgei]|jgi:AhpD family alkylhydroperoxidase|uniref:Argininosuccinate synthase n=1 Tax=Yokenella regensburgei TaxID=158877 RepID=A0AB38FT24_9ENTR|nr:carboxymuconolactone decarboxylase family protein [Yokenella regensburgei]KFD23484.1 carboxymuconolactone decarboxylase family protein [Yokenella regensburgei ATCC 49455]MDR3106127.1 carboxymuconolactone decarboxylase family protein [Yokenella regensburgei]SQA62389.1 Argininosuccinate synthase [Yokenella regensburgei]SQA96121.1 Argininosuccinate synthase [Yokenella regensburgei]SUQ04243.1 Argininosuccinate synthase [Yokenella regensburgei]
MTTLRQPYYELSPEVYNAFVHASKALEKCSLESTLIELVYLRISQINGCAFCLEMHSKALRKSGVEQTKLDALAGWRVSHHFSERECAALAWAEDVTLIADTRAEDAVYEPLLAHFSAVEISDLTLAVALMNAFNRLAVSMRM